MVIRMCLFLFQTPDDWEQRKDVKSKKKHKKSHRRSASFGHGDQLAVSIPVSTSDIPLNSKVLNFHNINF